MFVNSVENLSLQIWIYVVTQIETFKHSNNRALSTIYHTIFSRNHNSFEAKNHPAFQICSALNHNVVVTMHCQILYYLGYSSFPPTFFWTFSDCSHCLSPRCYQQSLVQSWLEKEWEECVWSWESFIDSTNHPFSGPYNNWWQPKWDSHEAWCYHWGNWSNVPCPEGR